jgi:hypothetical protein
MYNYYEAMANDIREYLADTYTAEELAEKMADVESFREELNDDLWTIDSVTGNASGSYTFSRETAKSYVLDNMTMCIDAMKEFCVEAETIAEKFLSEDWEYFDVTIRCAILGQVIYTVTGGDEQ